MQATAAPPSLPAPPIMMLSLSTISTTPACNNINKNNDTAMLNFTYRCMYGHMGEPQ